MFHVSRLKHSIGLIFVIIISTCPVFLWAFTSPTPPAFTSPTTTLLALGQLSAILGTTLFALNFVLSARFPWLEKYFNGLNRMYFYHHYIGAASLILLLFHPLLLALQYLPISIVYVAKFFIPSTKAPENIVGSLALLIMIGLLYITFFTKIKYQIWKFTHQFLGLSFFVAIIHMLIVPGNLDENKILKAYLLALSALAMYAVIYRTVLFKRLVKRYAYTIDSFTVTGEVTELTLAPVKSPMSYQPGQFVFFEITSKGINTEIHPFSLISAPNSPHLSFAAKSLGDYTETLKLVKVGDPVLIEGPYGVFSYLNTANTHQLWIAGGIGVTPFVSMARSLDPTSPYIINFIYAVSDASEAIYKQDFENTASHNSKFKFYLHSSKESGRLDIKKIEKLREYQEQISKDIELIESIWK
jgi:predicted ferric reductase